MGGNKALKAMKNVNEVEICVGDTINCHPTCHRITKAQIGNYNCQNANSAGYHGTYKNTLAQLAGVCLTPGAPHSSAQKILKCPSSTDPKRCFNMNSYRGNSFMSAGRGSAPYGVYYHWSGDHREWHTWGCGISYSPEGLLPHNGGHKYEWGMYQSPGSSCAPRTHMNLIQLRVKKNAAYGKPSEWSKTHTPSCKHESGWTYVMEVEDEVNVDDIPDGAYDRVDGWARRNSF